MDFVVEDGEKDPFDAGAIGEIAQGWPRPDSSKVRSMALVVRDLLRRIGSLEGGVGKRFVEVDPRAGDGLGTASSSLRLAKAPAALRTATRTPGIHDRMQGRARGRLGRRSWPSGSIALMTAKASGKHLILTACGMGV